MEESNIPVKKVTKRNITRKINKNPAKTAINLVGESGRNNKSSSTKTAKKTTKSFGLYRKIAFSFIILTFLLIAVIFYLSAIKVSIFLIPNQEKLSDNLTVDVYDQSQSALASEKNVVGVVKQVDVELTKSYPVSGKEILGQEVTGKVLIINSYNKNQPLVATTRLLTPDNKLFRIKDTVNVPAGGQIEVVVYADEAKPEMAIGPTTFTIPGLWAGLQDKIYGQSKEPMKYLEKVKQIIAQGDIDQATKDLKENLVGKAKDEIGTGFKDYDQVIYQIDNNSINQQLDSKVGEEKANFSATMKTKVTVVAFKDDKMLELAKQKLTASLPDDKELIEFNKKDLNYSLNNYNLNQGTASVDVSFSGKMALKDKAQVIDRKKIVGLNDEQLKQYLNNLPEIAGYEIKFFPSFIKKVPSLVDRIDIEIKK